jgi:hypothetical protein
LPPDYHDAILFAELFARRIDCIGYPEPFVFSQTRNRQPAVLDAEGQNDTAGEQFFASL